MNDGKRARLDSARFEFVPDPPIVKFCGLRTAADVQAVNQVFAESNGRAPKYAGFICVPGRRRFVPAAQVLHLRKLLAKEIKAVGVFQNAPLSDICLLVENGGIDAIQLHGREDAHYIAQLRKALSGIESAAMRSNLSEPENGVRNAQKKHEKIELIQAFGIESAADLALARESTADFVLLDAVGGGSGATFNWQLLQNFPQPYFLAGGLHPKNVRAAIELLAPFGIDVSSGIEDSSGVKDLSLMRDFLGAVWQTSLPPVSHCQREIAQLGNKSFSNASCTAAAEKQ